MEQTKPIILVPAHRYIEPDCDEALRKLEKQGYFVWRSVGGSAIDLVRNEMVSQALAQGFQEIIWIDSDIAFDVDDVEKLRRHNKPIVSGLYPIKAQSGKFCGRMLPATGVAGSLVELAYVGCGFLYTKAEVYSSIVRSLQLPVCHSRNNTKFSPWFMPLIDENIYYPEDAAFCVRARKSGYTIYGDNNVRLRHIGSHAYTLTDFPVVSAERGNKLVTPFQGIDNLVSAKLVVLVFSDSTKEDLSFTLNAISTKLTKSKIEYIVAVVDSTGLEEMTCATAKKVIWLQSKPIFSEAMKVAEEALRPYELSRPHVMIVEAGDDISFSRIDLLESAVQYDLPIASTKNIPTLTGSIYRLGDLPKCTSKFSNFDDFNISRMRLCDFDFTRRMPAGPREEVQEENDKIIARLMKTAYKRVWSNITEVSNAQLVGGYETDRAKYCFNPSLLEYGKDKWLFYRHDTCAYPHQPGWLGRLPIEIRAVKLDAELKPIKETDQAISIVPSFQGISFEDPRVVHIGEHIWMTISEPDWDGSGWTQVGVKLVKMSLQDDKFTVINSLFPPFGNNPRMEKNWAPFVYNGKLLINYSMHPHVVFNPLDATEKYESIGYEWPFGRIHGGTPPVLVGNEYYSFFHDRFNCPGVKGNPLYYAMGALAFDAKPPFKITRFTNLPIMWADGITSPLWGCTCVFPAGALYNTVSKEWLISYGSNDMNCRFVTIPHTSLLSYMEVKR